MSKDKGNKSKPSKKTPTPQRSEEAPSPLHSGSEAVQALHERDNPAMSVDSDAEIAERMRRSDSGASNPHKAAYRHGATGQYTQGPSMPDMGHEVLDLGDPAAQAAMTRTTPTSRPNGLPVGPNDRPAASIFDSGDLGDLNR